MTLQKAITKRIDEYLKERRITLNKLCTMSGVVQSTVNNITSGKTEKPQVETIYNLCIGLEITISEFFNSPLFAHGNIVTD